MRRPYAVIYYFGFWMGTAEVQSTGSGESQQYKRGALREAQNKLNELQNLGYAFFISGDLDHTAIEGLRIAWSSLFQESVGSTSSPLTIFETQNNWRYCNKCQGLFFAGVNMGVCPTGDSHDLTGSGDYALVGDYSL